MVLEYKRISAPSRQQKRIMGAERENKQVVSKEKIKVVCRRVSSFSKALSSGCGWGATKGEKKKTRGIIPPRVEIKFFLDLIFFFPLALSLLWSKWQLHVM